MSVPIGMPVTLESLLAAKAAREADQVRKHERYRLRRRRMSRRLALGGGLAALLYFLILRFCGVMPWLGIGIAGLAGAGLGALIGWWNLGLLRGLMLYGFGIGLLQVGGGMVIILSVQQSGFASTGALIFYFLGIVWHISIGGILGLANELFDRDHLQI